MGKVSKYYEKKRKEKIKVLPKEERKRLEEIERICARAKKQRKDIKTQKAERDKFYRNYFLTLRPENTSKIYPSLIENKANPSATAKRGILEQKIKLALMDPDMREREEKAIEKALETAKSVAPAYNKGGYQLISKNELTSIGKKYEY